MARGGNSNNSTRPVTGSGEDDVLETSTAAMINGGDGNDNITGSDGADDVRAGDGDDTITGGLGDDTIFGNDGTDTAMVSDLSTVSLEEARGNSWIMTSADGTDTLKHIELISDGTFTYTLGENNAVYNLGDEGATDEDSGVDIDLFDGAFDVEGDAFAVTSFDDSATLGSVVVAANGVASYDPAGAFEYLAEGETATDTFSYTVQDDAGNETTTTVTVTVTGANDGPVVSGVGNTGAVTEDDVIVATGTVEATDVDATDELTWSGNSTGAYGELTIDADGNWTYTLDNANPAVQALGATSTPLEETFTVTVTDGTENADEEITVTINGTNDAPVASGVGNTGSVTEDSVTEATGTVEATDVDTDDTLTWSGGGAGSYGSLAIDADGHWTYTLDNGNPAVQALDADSTPLEDVFLVNVSDGTVSTTEQITVTVNGTDDELPEIAEGNLTAPGTAIGSVAQAGWYNSANPDHSDYWYVNLTAGDTVTIRVDRIESALDPALFVFQGTIDDPLATFGTNIDFGSEAGYIGFADDEIWRNDGPYGDPLLTFTAPTSGQYTLIVTNYLSGGDHGGDFRFDYQISVDVA